MSISRATGAARTSSSPEAALKAILAPAGFSGWWGGRPRMAKSVLASPSWPREGGRLRWHEDGALHEATIEHADERLVVADIAAPAGPQRVIVHTEPLVEGGARIVVTVEEDVRDQGPFRQFLIDIDLRAIARAEARLAAAVADDRAA